MLRNRLNPVALRVLLVALPGILIGPLSAQAGRKFIPDGPNEMSFPAEGARFVRFAIKAAVAGQPCIDELEIYADGGKTNLALSADGAKASASSCLSGYPIHQIAHLNDGRYGNSHSWISAGDRDEWAQIELPQPAHVQRVVFSRDREGTYRDRMPQTIEIQLSLDGQTWRTVCRIEADVPAPAGQAAYVPPVELPEQVTPDGLLRYALLCELATWKRMPAEDHLSPLQTDRPALPGGPLYWSRIAHLGPLERVLVQMDEMLERLAAKGVDTAAERTALVELRQRQAALAAADTADDGQTEGTAAQALYLDARLAKRRLMFRDPDLAPLQKILFVKRHPYLASHNYSDVLDSQFRPGGGVCVLDIPRSGDRLEPADAQLSTLFDASAGIARDPVADFDGRRIYFAYRPNTPPGEGLDCYWNLMAVDAGGGPPQQLTDGPFHDYYPCPLPDGSLAFISTRCKCRFLCWRPQAFVLFRMNADGADIQPLSLANLSEWTPATMRDGRILWTRSEYLDKGADFGHTLWAIRPDGAHPELIFGNNTPNCYMNGREVPGSREILCTLVSHGGDHNGPIGLIDLSKGPFDTAAVTNITPDSRPHYNMNWARYECFRDPSPVSRDYFVVSHAAADRFGLYVIDRYGNREQLYLDPDMGSMSPTVLTPRVRGPVLNGLAQQPSYDARKTESHGAPAGPSGGRTSFDPQLAAADLGQFTVADVYAGLEPAVARGTVKYIRVCQEVRADLEQLANGEFRKDHGPDFTDFYATPINRVNGPYGWPSYVAKASLGLAPVEADGSASFYAPAGKVLYFQALDEQYTELQRMRSVVQLQPGEQRSCVGCHENRQTAPPVRLTLAARRPPSQLQAPSWGAVPFAYESVVQPVWDAKCVRCHDATDKQGFDLSGHLDAHRVPASYRTLIAGGWVHYFNFVYGLRHSKAQPLTFGTLQSKLWPVLDHGHYEVQLTDDQLHRVKCWIDLNCPLWPDYTYRLDRPE